jgi:catechol 2,3-dioxygenase-like lactoylglutathione lyase family enzyme
MRPQPLLSVSDVEASSAWYQRILDAESEHGGDEYERLTIDGTLILQLHSREVDHDHDRIGDPAVPYGNGVLLWFETDDFDAAVKRAKSARAVVVKAPHVNPNAQHREVWLRDPDGFIVVIASPDGEAAVPTRAPRAANRKARR